MWVAVSRVVVNLIGFASTVLLARLLTPSDFGLVAIATGISAVIMAMTELSLSQALIRCRDPQEDHYDTAFTLNLIRAVLLAGLIAAIAVPFARFYGDPRLTAIILVAAGLELFGALTSPRLATFQRQLEFRQDFILQLSQKLLGFIVAVAITLIRRDYWGLVAGSAATGISAVLISQALAPHRPRLCLTRAREMMSFSAWMTLNFAVRMMNWRMDALFVGYALGAKPAGLYTMADNLASMPTREAMQPIVATLLPALSRLTDDRARLREAYQRANSLLCAIAFPIGIGFALIAKPLILLLLSDKWEQSIPLVQVLSCTIAIQMAGWSMQPLGGALGRSREIFNTETLAFLVRLPLMFAGLLFGLWSGLGALMGVALGRAVGSLFGITFNMMQVKRMIALPVRVQVAGLIRPLIASAVMAAAVVGLSYQFPPQATGLNLAAEIIVTVAAGGLVYIVTGHRLWRMLGYPPGAESEVIAMIAKYVPSFARLAPGGRDAR